MKISQVKDYLIKTIKAGENHTSYVLIGHTGIGKTSIIKQVAKEVNLPLVEVNLFTGSKEDFTGVMDKKNDKTVWYKPEWMLDEPFILLLDEFNRVLDSEVRAIASKLIEEHRIHTHQLPEGTFIFLTGNPPDSVYETVPIDPAWQRRITQIILDFDVNDFLNYIEAQKWDNRLIKFFKTHTEHIFKDPIEGKILPNPASWEKVNRKIVGNIISVPMTDSDIELIAGDVGEETTLVLAHFLKTSKKEVTLEPTDFKYNPDKFIKDLKYLQNNNMMDRLTLGIERTVEEIAKDIPKHYVETLEKILLDKKIQDSIKLLIAKRITLHENLVEPVAQTKWFNKFVEELLADV